MNTQLSLLPAEDLVDAHELLARAIDCQRNALDDEAIGGAMGTACQAADALRRAGAEDLADRIERALHEPGLPLAPILSAIASRLEWVLIRV